MVTIGTLGALDPWLHKVNQKNFSSGDPGVPFIHSNGESAAPSVAVVVEIDEQEDNMNETKEQKSKPAGRPKQFLWRSKLPSFYGVKVPLKQQADRPKRGMVSTRRRSEIIGMADRPAMPLKERRKSSQASLQSMDMDGTAAKTRSKSGSAKPEEGQRRKSSIRQMLEIAVLSTRGGTPKSGQRKMAAMPVQGSTGGDGKEDDMQHQMKRMRSLEDPERRSVGKPAILPSVRRFKLDKGKEEAGMESVEPSSILPSMVDHAGECKQDIKHIYISKEIGESIRGRGTSKLND